MATPVRIVRPTRSITDVLFELLYTLGDLAFTAWLVMLVAPLVGFRPGYWVAFCVVAVVRAVITVDSYRIWTSDK